MHLLLTDRLTCPRCGPTFGLILLADRVDERRVVEGWLGCPNCRDRFRVSAGFADLRAPPRDALETGLVGPPDEGGIARRPGGRSKNAPARDAAGADDAAADDAAAGDAAADDAAAGEAAAGEAAAGEAAAPTGEPHGASGGPAAAEAERFIALLGIAGGPGTIALVGGPARHGPALAAGLEEVQVVGIDPDLATWPDAPGFSRLVARPGMPFFGRVLRGVVVDGRLGPSWLEEAVRVVAPGSRVVVTHADEEAAPKLQGLGLTVLAAEAETVVAARS